jgi:nicotinate-nucleotide pyrophosphorylase (carboxylating)
MHSSAGKVVNYSFRVTVSPSVLPPAIAIDPILESWLREDIGRGDRTTSAIFPEQSPLGTAVWIAKASGVVAGLPIAARVFQLLDPATTFQCLVPEGTFCEAGSQIAIAHGSMSTLLMGERVALNLTMRLSGISTLTRDYVKALSDSSTKLVDTRKTTPGLRIFEKYATLVGGAINHRYGLDDAVMVKDNHIAAAGSITAAVGSIRSRVPFTTQIEVETETLLQVKETAALQVDVIMLDNMSVENMREAIAFIRSYSPHTKIEASGNVTLDTIKDIAFLGVDYISTSAMVTRSSWLDISMNILSN